MRLLPGNIIITNEGLLVRSEQLFEILNSEAVDEIQGWTLKDLMDYIAPHGELLGEMAWCNFRAFYEEMQKPTDEVSDWAKQIKWITVSKVAEVGTDGKIVEYVDVTGGDESGERYALGMTPINHLANLPLKIDNTYVLRDEFPPKNGERKTYYTGKKDIHLLEFIYGILYEISFYGSPDKRDEFNEELDRRVKSVKDGDKTYTIDEVKEHLETHVQYNLDNKGPCGAD